MKLSTRTRYAARALAVLGGHANRVVSIREIAENQQIPVKYLERLFVTLRNAGLVLSRRGSGGGYTLAKSPEDITLQDIYECMEGAVAPVHCVQDPTSCPMRDVCTTRASWTDLQRAIVRVLRETTVRDLADRQKQADDSSTFCYHI